jgi:hypothetical protein
MMKISINCPSSMLFLNIEERGMGLRKLWNLYREINIADMMKVINFVDKKSLYYNTSKQRLDDLIE